MPERQHRLAQLQVRVRELREGLARHKEQATLLVTIESSRPFTADERHQLRTIRLEAERLRLELARLRDEFEHLRA